MRCTASYLEHRCPYVLATPCPATLYGCAGQGVALYAGAYSGIWAAPQGIAARRGAAIMATRKLHIYAATGQAAARQAYGHAAQLVGSWRPHYVAARPAQTPTGKRWAVTLCSGCRCQGA